MSVTATATASIAFVPNRRRSARIEVAGRGLFCDLGRDNGGLVLDISKNGFSVQAIQELEPGRQLEIEMRSHANSKEARGRALVAWACEKRAGLRFQSVNCNPLRLISAPEPEIAEKSVEIASQKNCLQLADAVIENDAKLQQFLEHLVQGSSADGGALALFAGDTLICRGSSGSAPPVGVAVSTEAGLTGQCIQSGESVYVSDALQDSRLEPRVAERMNIRSVLVVPCRLQGELAGLIELFASAPGTLVPAYVLEIATELMDEMANATKLTEEHTSLPESCTSAGQAKLETALLSEVALPAARSTMFSDLLRVLENPVQLTGITAVILVIALSAVVYRSRTSQLEAVAPPANATLSTQSQSKATDQPPVITPPVHEPVLPARSAASQVTLTESTPIEASRPTALPKPVKLAQPSAPVVALNPSLAVESSALASAAEVTTLPTRASAGVQEGKLVKQVAPVFPRAATGRTGSVKLRISVDENGAVSNVTVLTSDDQLFSIAARAALMQWRYAPSILDGTAVPVEHVVTINFRQPAN